MNIISSNEIYEIFTKGNLILKLDYCNNEFHLHALVHMNNCKAKNLVYHSNNKKHIINQAKNHAKKKYRRYSKRYRVFTDKKRAKVNVSSCELFDQNQQSVKSDH